MAIKSIKGTLAPTNAPAITKQTASKINNAVSVSGLSEVIKPSPAWHHGIIVSNISLSKNDLTGFEFMSNLRKLIHAEGVEKLALTGTLMVRVDTKPNEFKVIVEDGNISCEEIKFSHLTNPAKSPLNHVLQIRHGQLMSVLVTE